MNFLAHLYLAEGPEGKIGNFIADAVKGKQHNLFSAKIQQGILHHRAIDSFTDTHSIVKISKRRLQLKYGHYKAVIIDILYDHFLAKNWSLYSSVPLEDFCQNTYNLLQTHQTILPKKTKHLLPYMTEQNWLYNYRTTEGISQILWGMNQRTKGLSQMDLASQDLLENYREFEDDFTLFFEDLQGFSATYLKNQKHTQTLKNNLHVPR
jgi:acyl carrier protein phosphodiesterase